METYREFLDRIKHKRAFYQKFVSMNEYINIFSLAKKR